MTASTMRTKRFNHRYAFTLIEVITVMAIIGILLAIIISAVQAAREAARRTQCSSNLRQVGIALHSYNTVIGSLPLTVNGKHGYSVQAMILPHLSYGNMFNSLNFSLSYADKANVTVAQSSVATFLCPSDYQQGSIASSNNYACNVGYGYQLSNKYNGMFVKRPQVPTTIADVPDGASNTVLMAEWILGSNTQSINDPLSSVYRTPKALLKPDQFDQFLAECKALNIATTKGVLRNKGRSWLHGSHGQTVYNHNISIGGRSCLNGTRHFEGAWTADSRHRSGANVLFSDGRVAFVSESITLPIWRAVATRDGNEVFDRQGF